MRCTGNRGACAFPLVREGLCALHLRDQEEIEKSRLPAGPRPTRKTIVLDHVLLHGVVFPRAAKEPFIPSGVSLRGALEYNPPTDQVRCHECGELKISLGAHLRQEHDLSAAEYRQRHGLAQSTALQGARLSAEQRVALPSKGLQPFRKGSPGARRCSAKAVPARKLNPNYERSTETMNLRNKCRAQLITRITALGQKLGRTPSHRELRAAGLEPSSFIIAFGSMAEALRRARLTPRPHGIHVHV